MKNSNISFGEFCDSFGESYKNNFSYEGKRALYDYLEQYEEETGEEVENDPIAFCCDYTEYEDLEELKANYNDIKTMEELENHTTVIPITDIYGKKTEKFIIQNF